MTDHKGEVEAVRLSARVEWLLADNPEWPQPVDPFDQLPRPERATGRGDWVL